jgi:hypothetical protein
MTQGVDSRILLPRHTAAGLYTQYSGNEMMIMRKGQAEPVAVFMPAATIENILKAADDAINTGIQFVKE